MRPASLVFGLILSAVSAFPADQQLMNLVMPDAKVVAGINITSSKISPLGQFILAKISPTDPHLQEVIAATGFDPRQDITELLAATSANPAAPGGLLLVRGTFNVDRILAAITTAAPGATSETYAGFPLISVSGPKATTAHAVAFIGSSIAVAGDVGSVKAALDRNSAANSIDPALATKVSQLSAEQDEWIASSASFASLLNSHMPAGAPAGIPAQGQQILNSVKSFSAGVKFGPSVLASAEAVTSDPANASALASVVRMLVSLLAVGANNDPKLAEASQTLQSLVVTTSGPAVDLSLSIPETQIEALLNTAHQARPQARNRHRRSGF